MTSNILLRPLNRSPSAHSDTIQLVGAVQPSHSIVTRYPSHTGSSVSDPNLSQSQVPAHIATQASQTAQPAQQWPPTNGLDAQNTAIPAHHPQYPMSNLEDKRKQADWQPWRYRGYPAFSKWMASDDDFFVLRRFGDLSARVALHMQDQISQMEEDLHNEDAICRKAPDGLADNGTFRYDPQPRRREIMGVLASTLERYQRFVLDQTALKQRPNASAFQIRNVRRWLKNAKNPIEPKEIQFIQNYRLEDDLIPVVNKLKTPLRRFVDKFDLVRLACCFREGKRNRRLFDPEDFEMETTIYNKEPLLDKVVTCATIALGMGMLIGPLWWLQHLTSHDSLEERLAVITGFLVVFTLLLSTLTVARPFDVLIAAAAYGAVLMVFMQLGGGAASG